MQCGKLYMLPSMNKQLPSIPRIITESLSSEPFFIIKYAIVGAVCAGLIMAIAFQGINLRYNLQESKRIAAERNTVVQEVVYWKQIADTYSGYRDIYFRIAALQYKLGNKEESKVYIKKALDIDPNFQDARVLGAKIEATHK